MSTAEYTLICFAIATIITGIIILIEAGIHIAKELKKRYKRNRKAGRTSERTEGDAYK